MGFSGTIRRLKDALRRLRDLLELPWVVENPDEEAKDWREEATELCYDLEDAIDKYSSSVTSSPSADEDAQAALDQLRGRATAALSEFNNLLSLRESSNCVDQIEDDPNDASFPVGIEDPTEKIIELLNLPHQSDDKAHKVVSIVGLAGSGKTTLAAQVYTSIADKFECKARVFVTRRPNVKGILINLLQKLGGNGDSLDDLHELTLVRLIQDHVQDKRFLVLAEDVSDENTWMVIRCALSHNNNSCGRIIMTTRINYIASLGDSVYRIFPLSKENSKSLLLKNVQLSLSDDTLDKILEKCGGLPLALISMSNVLKKVESADHWEKLYNSMNSADTEDSIKSMRRKLYPGYYELSYHLRMCLLYLSIFPARHEIKRKRLVHRWIAQGLVHAQYGENVAEKATCYFNELINRNWIEPVNIKSDGQARACRVHNVILDFIVYKSAEENFVTLLGSSSENQKKIHNLSIKNMQDSTKLGGVDVSHVRSLTIFGELSKPPPCPLKSDVLRVLDLEDYYGQPYFGFIINGIKTIVDASSLIHLRYLSVRAAGRNGLREEVAKMRHLETLELRERQVREVQQLELDITELQHLVRLSVDSETTLKAEMKNMKALEEVKYISVSKHSEGLLKELGQLAKLRVLGIHLDAEETPDEQKKAMALASSLHKLGNSELHSLYIDGSWEVSLNLSTSDGDSRQPTLTSLQKLKFRKWCYVNEVPGWIASLQNLEILRLGTSKMKQNQLAILGALPCLVDLFLDILEVHGEEIMFQEVTGFRYLKCLGISYRTRMKVTFGEKSVPCLEHLKLHVDVRGGVIPEAEGCKFVVGIAHLSSLTKFDALIYCARKTDPVVKHVKDAMQKEAGDGITTYFTEKEEREGVERVMLSTIGDMVRNMENDKVQELESAQIDIKKLQDVLEDTRRFLMMLLDDENPKHQVLEWRNTVQDLFLSTFMIMLSLYSTDFSSSSLQTLRLNIEKMESLPPKKSSGLSSGSKATDKSERPFTLPYTRDWWYMV